MNERYLSFPTYCKKRFHKRLYRVALDAHMSCPTRDGSLGIEGCLFCERGSGDFAIDYHGQLLNKEDFIYNHVDAGEGEYIAYFQSYTNTYAPVEKLKILYEGALENPLFAGISIATRPDCFSNEIYALLANLKKRYPDKFIWVELGLQTSNEESAAYIQRGYSNPIFEECVKRLHEIGIEIIVHLIIGLPKEMKEDMISSIQYINEYPIQGVKLQLLHYLKGSVLGKMYEEDPSQFSVLSLEEYVDIITDCIGYLREDIIVHRLSGDGNAETLLAPLWSKDKKKVLNSIRHALKEKDIYQGCFREE